MKQYYASKLNLKNYTSHGGCHRSVILFLYITAQKSNVFKSARLIYELSMSIFIYNSLITSTIAIDTDIDILKG